MGCKGKSTVVACLTCFSSSILCISRFSLFFSLAPNTFQNVFRQPLFTLSFLGLQTVKTKRRISVYLSVGSWSHSHPSRLCVFLGDQTFANYISKIPLPSGFQLLSAMGGIGGRLESRRNRGDNFFCASETVVVVDKSRFLVFCPREP